MLDNEIQFELKKLESKLYSLLKNYNELKNKTEELNQKNEDIYIKLTLKDLEISKLKNQKQLSILILKQKKKCIYLLLVVNLYTQSLQDL